MQKAAKAAKAATPKAKGVAAKKKGSPKKTSPKKSNPTISIEKSRSQVRCRDGKGGSFSIPYGKHGGVDVGKVEQAVAKVNTWKKKLD